MTKNHQQYSVVMAGFYVDNQLVMYMTSIVIKTSHEIVGEWGRIGLDITKVFL
jgi:hypothetical protein